MNKNTTTNTLIGICFVVTILEFFVPNMVNFGMNSNYLLQKDYIALASQFMLYQFLHGGLLHLVSNSLFLYIFGNQLEYIIGQRRYFTFFITNTIFTGTAILLFTLGTTIGISGFAMAVLAYIFLYLKGKKHPDYKSAGLFLIINIAIGIGSNISFVGHLSGAIYGIIYYYLTNLTKK